MVLALKLWRRVLHSRHCRATTDIEVGGLGSSVPITAPLLVDGFEGSWPPDGWLLQQLAPTGLWSPTTDAEMVHSGSVAAIHLWGYGEADSGS